MKSARLWMTLLIAAGLILETLTEWGAPVHVEMSQERFRDLQLVKGETVFIIPKDIAIFKQ